MDTIFLELWQGLKALTGPQWVVLLALSMVIGFALFAVFRWIYGARAEAQDSLIKLKEEIIEHYQTEKTERTDPVPLSAVLPEDWHSYLIQPYEQLEGLLNESTAQQMMNYTSANMGFVKDADLFILYLQHFYSLPREQAVAFKSEQQAWLRSRREYSEAAGKEYHGGTLASLEYNLAFIQKTEERIVELKRRVKDVA